jgi:putative two-component system response regulator|tara:strand:+ start:487 stop:702 length:216 start_codon:yes stop_codon:yes gene_type:complete
MSQYRELLGKAYGMNDAECKMFLKASPMHDVGKIGIPDRVLLKPGKLNDEEWQIMKTHSKMGAEILSQGTS